MPQASLVDVARLSSMIGGTLHAAHTSLDCGRAYPLICRRGIRRVASFKSVNTRVKTERIREAHVDWSVCIETTASVRCVRRRRKKKEEWIEGKLKVEFAARDMRLAWTASRFRKSSAVASSQREGEETRGGPSPSDIQWLITDRRSQ